MLMSDLLGRLADDAHGPTRKSTFRKPVNRFSALSSKASRTTLLSATALTAGNRSVKREDAGAKRDDDSLNRPSSLDDDHTELSNDRNWKICTRYRSRG